MVSLGLNGKYHPFLDNDIAIPTQNWFLLVKPWAHAVTDKSGRVINVLLSKFIQDEFVQFAGRHAKPAFLDRFAVNIQRNLVSTLLFIIWWTQDCNTGLMASVSL